MENFYLNNLDRFKTLLAKYVPEPEKKDSKLQTRPNPDMVVCSRVRPLSEEELEAGIPDCVLPRPKKTNMIDAHDLRQPPRGKPLLKTATFQLDHCFGTDAETEDIYTNLVEPLVPWAWGGGIGTLFAYGQTGSGKTYTVSALEKLVAEALMNGSLDGERKVHISIIELAGNTARDLLNSSHQISILEDSFGVTQLAGAVEHQVTKLDEILAYIEEAASFRRTEATLKNDTSSRSHAVCRFRIAIPTIPNAEDGMLYLIDLAGSEAARDRSAHDTTRMKEAREINRSLSVLKDCIRGKAESDALEGLAAKSKKKPYVPFRQSALTKVLKHVFDPASTRGATKTVVVACVNPNILDIVPSRNTLRYAELLRVVLPKGEPLKFNPDVPMTWSNEQLRAWIDKESGSPPISSAILAPQETGLQALRMPPTEFELRCLKTSGVNVEQAQAFRSKLWQLHVDSQRARATSQQDDSAGKKDADEVDTIMGHLKLMDRDSSKEADAEVAKRPFKERLRPGMVVSYKPPREYIFNQGNIMHMVMILSPVEGLGSHVKDLRGRGVNGGGKAVVEEEEEAASSSDSDEEEKEKDAKVVETQAKTGEAKKFLCALITPGVLTQSYALEIWRQVVVDTDMMLSEVTLEFDAGSRYYFIAL